MKATSQIRPGVHRVGSSQQNGRRTEQTLRGKVSNRGQFQSINITQRQSSKLFFQLRRTSLHHSSSTSFGGRLETANNHHHRYIRDPNILQSRSFWFKKSEKKEQELDHTNCNHATEHHNENNHNIQHHKPASTKKSPSGVRGSLPKAAALEGVTHLIAVASGKGGVGKSTTAVNLACALSRHSTNPRVGILDGDIYGPSIPLLMNLVGRKPDVNPTNNKFDPLVNYGIKAMSMGFLIEEDAATIWRGPMVMSAVEQLLRNVNWAPLDYLVIDLPPGTGDAQLTLCQRTPLSGAIIVSTPQDVALIDVRRGVNMFKKVEVPLLGIVENMSYFECGKCGEVSHIFGHGGAQKTAIDMGMDFLGHIPLHIDIRETSDAGKPIVISNPSSSHSKPYFDIAENVIAKLNQKSTSSAPKIVFE